MQALSRPSLRGCSSYRLFCAPPTLCAPQSRCLTVIVEMGRRAAKIANRKGKADAKKSKLYGRMGKRIITLVKAGGADPTTNVKLAETLKQARELGVPKDIIERNTKKALDKSQADFVEVAFEAYGPGGTGFIVECLTDNNNRTAGDVRSIITKSGCKIADPGSVAFSFNRCGQVVVAADDEDKLFEAAMDAGGQDIQPRPADEEGGASTSYKVLTAVEDFSTALKKMQSLGYTVDFEESGIVFVPAAPVEVDDDAFAKCEGLVERLLQLDDVDAVYSNCDGLEF